MEPSGGSAGSPPHPTRGTRILVVDDEPWIATLVREILVADGHAVDAAANGVMALRKIEEHRYDLIVCDVRMPELDGLGLYRELAQRQPELLRRFLFITGNGHDAVAGAFLRQTGAPFLQKPFTVRDLHELTQQMIRSG